MYVFDSLPLKTKNFLSTFRQLKTLRDSSQPRHFISNIINQYSTYLIVQKQMWMLLTIVGSSHTQLQELEEKYSECIEMLHEAQEELKNLRNRSVSAGTPRRYHPLGLFPMVHKQTRSYITHARPVLLEITNTCIFWLNVCWCGFAGGNDKSWIRLGLADTAS